MALLLTGLLGCGQNPNSDITHITNVGQTVTVYLVNQSEMPQDKVNSMVAAINVQLSQDFYPAWGINATLVNQDPPNSSYKSIYIIPDFSRFPANINGQASGFHTTGSLAYVDYALCKSYGITTKTTSHEVLELLANPNVDPAGYEVSDPVAPLGYLIGDEVVADFVYPNFYVVPSTGPWDHNRAVEAPMRAVPGGYLFLFLSKFVKGITQ